MGRRTTISVLTGLAAVVIALLAAACGGSDAGLVVYSGRSEELVGPLFEQFQEETGIQLDVRYGDSADLALLIAEEGDRSPADVFYSQSPGAVAFLAERELLGSLGDDTLQQVDAELRSPDGEWIGITGRQRVLVYNADEVDEADLPASIDELTDPEYRDRVAVAPANGSFQDFVTAMRQTRGDEATEEWLAGMAANNAPNYAKNSAIVDAVARGEVPMGLVNHYYNFRALAEDGDLPSRNHLFEGGDLGAVVLPSTASLVAGSERSEDAEALIDFLLSPAGQSYFSEETFEYPLAGDTAPSADLPPLSGQELPDYDIGRLADLGRTVELIRESGLEQ